MSGSASFQGVKQQPILRITRARTPAPTSLFYFLVFGSRLFQDGDVKVGVFPGSVAGADATNHTGEDARAYIAILVSRTRLSLLSGWGCQGRRLSKAWKNHYRRCALWQRRLAMRRRERGRDGRVPPAGNSARCRGD